MSTARAAIDNSAPATLGILRSDKYDYTFTDDKLIDITRGNASLLDRLHRVATRKTGVTSGPVIIKKESSQSINRRKQAAEIERQNMAMLRRLQTAKPTLTKKMLTNTTPKVRDTAPPLSARSSRYEDAEAPYIAPAHGDAYPAPTAPAVRRSSGSAVAGTMKTSRFGRVGVPPPRGGVPDRRDVEMSACRDDYL
jgi:hypothetical protein